MKRATAILVAFFFLRISAHGDSFASGNEAYASGKPADAIQRWEDLVAKKQYSEPLFFNLGNAYFKDGKTGAAILNYERALWMKPSDPDAKANLKYVRSTAGLFEPTREWWQVVPQWASLEFWGVLACVAWFGFSCSLILFWWKPKAGLRAVIAVFAVLLPISAAAAIIRLPDMKRAVVQITDAPLRVAPLEKSPVTVTLKAGDIVRIENKRESFIYVETEDGKTGWAITGAEIAPVIPDF